MIRAAESFQIICSPEQLEKMLRVISHNGGVAETIRTEHDAVYLVIVKGSAGGEETHGIG